MEKNKIDGLLKKEVINENTPSVSYVIFTKDSLIHQFRYGMADIQNKKETNEKTTYNAFSMTNALYMASFIEIFFAIFFVHFTQGHISLEMIDQKVLLDFYGLFAFGIVLRVFAAETVSLRKKQDELSKNTKQHVAQKKEIYLLIDNISDGLIAVDNDKKITLINKSSLKILGMVGSVKNLAGKNFDEVINATLGDTVTVTSHTGAITRPTTLQDTIDIYQDEWCKTVQLLNDIGIEIETETEKKAPKHHYDLYGKIADLTDKGKEIYLDYYGMSVKFHKIFIDENGLGDSILEFYKNDFSNESARLLLKGNKKYEVIESEQGCSLELIEK
jgi:transcriptional regulator with PAS, ATPase and Fis domain